jgi:hypothetical protein
LETNQLKTKSDIARHSKERKNGKAHTIGIGLRKKLLEDEFLFRF